MGLDQQAAIQFGAHVAPAVQRGEDGFHGARVLDINVEALWHRFVHRSNPVSVAGWGAASGEGITAMTELVAGLTLSQRLAALAWMLNNLVIGSVGGTLAEGMVLVTNIINIIRLYRLQKQYPGLDLQAPRSGEERG